MRARRRPADPEVGRGQAPAPARSCGPSIRGASSAISSRFSAAAPCSSICTTAACCDGREVRLSDINADIIGCYRAVRDAVERGDRGAARRSRPATGPDGAAHFYDVRDRAFNPARRRDHDRRRSGGGLHAGAGGDADLPEPHRLQRPVPRQRARRVQRARRPLRQSEDLRRSRTCARGAPRSAARACRSRSARSTPRWRGAGRGRLRLSRPAVCAAERDGAVHVVHRRRLRRRVSRKQLQRTVIALASRGASVLLSNSAAPADPAPLCGPRRRPPRPASGPRPSRPGARSTRAPPAAARSANTSSRNVPRCKLGLNVSLEDL